VNVKSAKGFNWQLSNIDIGAVNQIKNRLNIEEILARLLVVRNITPDVALKFLNPTLRDFMPDPYHLKDMGKAVDLISDAVIKNKKIVIFGDYDVDGATSSALLKRFFGMIDINVDIYIPDRMTEGYGPSISAFTKLKDMGVDLIITVDCGTVSFEAIEFAIKSDMLVIVVDHHLSSEQLPPAQALVNPNRYDESSEYKYLAAVGVVFLLIVALNSKLREKDFFANIQEPSLLQLLDIVAIGTICDVVPLEGINRAFVKQGLKILNQRKNLGIDTFYNLLKMEGEITAYHVGYVIGPRINAGGRVGESFLGARLLSTNNLEEATEIVNKLEHYNSERKAIEFSVFQKALEQVNINNLEQSHLIMVNGENWHQGVVGIVAGRLKEMFNKAVAVVTIKDGFAKASCRSIVGLDFGSAVVKAKEQGLLISGGGHKMAAGFTAAAENLVALKEFLDSRFMIELSSWNNNRFFDAYISVDTVNLDLANKIEQLAPFGAGNAEPRLVLQNVYIAKYNIFATSHINCFIACAESKNFSNLLKANAFRSVDTALGNMLINNCTKSINLVGYIRINRWRGKERAEFIIEDAYL
jgi:single-stranded-DNA-specific exonuclease